MAVPKLQNWLDHGIDFDNRLIYLSGDVNEQMAAIGVKGIFALDMAAKKGDEPITIILSSDGGCWYAAMAIYDAILHATNKVNVVVVGQAMSMAAVILQAANERIVAPNASIMIHVGSHEFSGHPENFKRWAEEDKRMTTRMEDIFVSTSGLARAKIREMLKFDTILTAQEAVELGFADRVLGQ